MSIRTNSTGWTRDVRLALPSLSDNTADADRVIGELKKQLDAEAVDIDLHVLKVLPGILRDFNYHVRCVLFKDRKKWILTGITPADDSMPVLGLAVDLGTTRVVIRIVDLRSKKVLAESAFDNPQIPVGPDILARVHFASQDAGLIKLNQLIIDELNQKTSGLCNENGYNPHDIYLVSVAGNTSMTHFFMGLDPRWIIKEPYIPIVNRPGNVKAHDLGINVNPGARVLIFPNIGSYFGGDVVAGILYSGMHMSQDPAILVDVGTNAEVVLGNKEWLIGCAGAAGPALEGGVTSMGMMAGPGVIDSIDIEPETHEFKIHTIEDDMPKGICGSGLIDLAAKFFLSGMIDFRGKFVPKVCGDRLKDKDGTSGLVIIPSEASATGKDLMIGQAELDSLIRSKAAMYTILETISSSVSMALKDFSTFYVAGTFGSFINPKSAIALGMLPDLPLDSYQSLGNSSLGGATLALTSCESADAIDRIRDNITYLELNVNQEFMNRFSAAKFLPHTDPSIFPSV
ncbi:MAG: DUF4445 domain-containing protein, partial [Deltaproteobacteria bacterium]|nr:DUF4445 domain-containing protein [Deltaproteobacteria bacterium]